MDGHFVPNLTIGPPVVQAVKRVATRPLDVHLMIEDPDRYAEAFVRAGAAMISVHLEVLPHLHRTIHAIKALGAKAGVVLNPSTPVVMLEEIAADLDYVLVMSVNPGFSGQQFIASSLDKVARARRMLDGARATAVLEVDGGINRDTIGDVWRAGADTFVAGNAVFSASDPGAEVAALRARCAHLA
jgi:ribulose-phosphate 3-epimerase